MKRSFCWGAVLSLGACAAFYSSDAYLFHIHTIPASPMLSPEHGTLFLWAAVAFMALGALALVLPRVAGLLGVGGYLVVLVMMVALVGDRARDYNLQHDLQFGDPGRQMPLHLVTEMPMWHLWRLGLPVLALSIALARASKAHDLEERPAWQRSWEPIRTN